VSPAPSSPPTLTPPSHPQAQKLASSGYRVVIPDLYRGKVGAEAEEAHHLMTNLDWPGAVEDVRGAARFLLAEGSPKVGVTGFCMGGALALAAAVHVAELSACVAFYGVPNAKLADTKAVRVPTQGHYGGLDPMKGFSDPLAAADLEEALKTAGVPHEVFIYPTVGHAFMNASASGVARKAKLGQGAHDQKAVDLAWQRTLAWFGKYLA
jgi:carboxymethylenebutenolidase